MTDEQYELEVREYIDSIDGVEQLKKALFYAIMVSNNNSLIAEINGQCLDKISEVIDGTKALDEKLQEITEILREDKEEWEKMTQYENYDNGEI